MGRKKIQISRIMDERNRQVRPEVTRLGPKNNNFQGHIYKTKVWLDEEGIRAVGPLRLRNCTHHFQQVPNPSLA